MKLTSSLLGCSSLNSSKISSVFYRQCGKSSGITAPHYGGDRGISVLHLAYEIVLTKWWYM